MSTEKIVVCSADDATSRVQPLLNEGWTTKFVISEIVSISASNPSTFSGLTEKLAKGKIVFILTK